MTNGNSEDKRFSEYKCGECARFKVPDAGCANYSYFFEYAEGKPLMDAQATACSDFHPTRKSKGEKNPKIRVLERPFGLPDPLLGTPFYEQAIVDEKLCFIVVDENGKIDFVKEIEVKGNGDVKTVIRPRLDLPYPQYVVRREWLLNPDSMLQDGFWTKGEGLLNTYVDFLEPWHAPISMAGVTLSYFYDAFQSVPYLYALGDTDSGKSRWSMTTSKLAYRAFYGESPPTADIYEFITNCGCTICEDEVEGLEKYREKLKLYKVGYQHGAKVMRILINRNTGERHQAFYNAYSCKFFAGEEEVKNKGFMDRNIVMPFVKGHPEKDQFDPADIPIFEGVRGKLLAMRVLVAAGKLSISPYTCNEPWFEGRFKELYKPLLSVMPDSKRQLIIEAAQERYEAKRAETTESVEAKCVLAYVEAVNANNGDSHVSTEIVYEFLKPMIEHIPEQYRPGLRNVGMKLTKLGFKRERLNIKGKRVMTRSIPPPTLTKLVRKYDLNDAIKEKGLPSPLFTAPKPSQTLSPITPEGVPGVAGVADVVFPSSQHDEGTVLPIEDGKKSMGTLGTPATPLEPISVSVDEENSSLIKSEPPPSSNYYVKCAPNNGEVEKGPGQQLSSREMLEVLRNELPKGKEFSEQQFLDCVINHGWTREDHDAFFRKLVDEGILLRTPGGGYIWT
jgi:hypothetical protein